jgi:hypothetical protein
MEANETICCINDVHKEDSAWLRPNGKTKACSYVQFLRHPIPPVGKNSLILVIKRKTPMYQNKTTLFLYIDAP